MFIVHGTKRKVRSLGWVADFCQICRRPQAFELFRIGLASHIYFISFGQGKLAGHLMQCKECATKVGTDESRYASIAKTPGTDFAALASTTMPNLPETLGARLAFEKQLTDGTQEVDPDTRREMLIEPFVILEGMIAERNASAGMDRPTSFGCLGTLVVLLGMVALVVFAKWSTKTVDYILAAGLTVVGAGGIYTFAQMCLSMRRYVRSQVLPRLVSSLAKLRPTEAEIAETLAACKKAKMKVARAVKADALWRELQRA
jgi:hypothetical protein